MDTGSNNTLTKVCSRCNRDRVLTAFYASRATKDGVLPDCKECNLKYQQTRRTIRKVPKSQKKVRALSRRLMDLHREIQACMNQLNAENEKLLSTTEKNLTSLSSRP